jgi:hypothetical protein
MCSALGPARPAEHDHYECVPAEELGEFAGRLFIEWVGRNWRQNGESVHPVVEPARAVRDPEFPGPARLAVHVLRTISRLHRAVGPRRPGPAYFSGRASRTRIRASNKASASAANSLPLLVSPVLSSGSASKQARISLDI